MTISDISEDVMTHTVPDYQYLLYELQENISQTAACAKMLATLIMDEHVIVGARKELLEKCLHTLNADLHKLVSRIKTSGYADIDL